MPGSRIFAGRASVNVLTETYLYHKVGKHYLQGHFSAVSSTLWISLALFQAPMEKRR